MAQCFNSNGWLATGSLNLFQEQLDIDYINQVQALSVADLCNVSALTTRGCLDLTNRRLTSLVGCPDDNTVHTLYCSCNYIRNLKGIPYSIKHATFINDFYLRDLSELPPDCESIDIRGCWSIKQLPKVINGTLAIRANSMLKQLKFCLGLDINRHIEIFKQDGNWVILRQKDIGQQLLSCL